ncbi:MAG: hypothetical protein EB060_05805 [Proteobacteria bacterium]|nr:hypothetical protein [Pseudomonadota bacterium]
MQRLKDIVVSPVAVFFLTALLIIVKAWPLFIDPRLWAEDATRHFADAAEHAWYVTLFLPEQGYLSLTANLGALIGVQWPLLMWPYAPLAVSFVIQLLPLLLLTYAEGTYFYPLRRKILFMCAYTALMMSASYQETWLNVVNSQFYLVLATAVILISYSSRAKWLQRAVLLLSGLSGVLSAAMLPVFFLKARQSKVREHTIQTKILAVAASIQLGYVVYCRLVGDYSPFRESGFSWQSMGGFYIRTILENFVPLTRFHINLAPKGTMAVINGLVGAAFFACLLKSRRSEIRLLLLGYLILSLLIFFGSLGDKNAFTDPAVGGRYFLPLSGLLIFALLFAYMHTRELLHRAVLALLIIMFFTSALTTAFTRQPPFFTGPSWKQSVAALGKKPFGTLRTWPEGWKLFYCKPAVCNDHTRTSVMEDTQIVQEKGFGVTTKRLQELYIVASGKGVILRVPEIRYIEPTRTLLRMQYKMPVQGVVRIQYTLDGKKATFEKRGAIRDILLLELPRAKRISNFRITLLGGKGKYRVANITRYTLTKLPSPPMRISFYALPPRASYL